MDKRRKKRVWFLTVLATVAALSLFVFSGCAKLASAINDIKGSLIGNQYTIYTYDNFGNLVLETSGKKIDIAGNPVKNTSYDENRSEERRVGKECNLSCRSRWSPYH